MTTETNLQRRAAAWTKFPMLEALTESALRQITQAEGIDFATALLFDRFQKDPRHAPFIRRINALRQAPQVSPSRTETKVVIVPGALYLERPDLGGNGRIVRQVAQSFGYETELLPIASFGSVRNNALIIRSWLDAHSEERMILVSLSKGGADLKTAFMLPDNSKITNVVAWINICGPLNGSRMADWVLASRARTWFFRLKCRLQKRDFQFITSLCRDFRPSLKAQFHPPSSMRQINLIGFPLRQHMTTRPSRFCHRTLSEWGPNDGTTCLSDVCDWPGETYPVWAADHYFRGKNLAQNLITALLHYLAEQHLPVCEVPMHRG